MSFHDRLKEARLARGLTQEKLGTAVGVAKPTIAGYEAGYRDPDMVRLQSLMDVLGIDANFLFQDEMKEATRYALSVSNDWARPLNDAYSTAPVLTQQNVCKLLDIPHVEPGVNNNIAEPATIDMIVYDYPAAAGLPLYAESDFERVSFPEDEIPSGADFGIRISGDSMEPTIHDGDIVWVRKQPEISNGQIGIFMLGDSSVCKRARCRADGRITALESDNPTYKPIKNSDLEDLRIVGKVLL